MNPSTKDVAPRPAFNDPPPTVRLGTTNAGEQLEHS